jgi:hypothetical protein
LALDFIFCPNHAFLRIAIDANGGIAGGQGEAQQKQHGAFHEEKLPKLADSTRGKYKRFWAMAFRFGDPAMSKKNAATLGFRQAHHFHEWAWQKKCAT